MAGPTDTPPVDTAAAAQAGVDPAKIADYERLADAQRRATLSQNDLTDATRDYSIDLTNLQGKLASFGVDMSNVNDLVGKQATAFGLLTAGVVQTKDMFVNLNSELRTNSLGSFTDQTKNLIDTVGNMGAVTGVATDAGKKLLGILSNMGLGGKALAEVMTYSGAKLAQFAKSVMTGADNSLRFQSILFQGAARGGAIKQLYDGIDESFTGIGEHLGDLNKVTAQFQSVMMDAADATGQTADQMAGYMSYVLQAPDGLGAMSKGLDIGGQHMESLTAVTQLAQGAGLDITQTYKDINQVLYDTGMTYQDGTRFAARFADVSKDLGARSEQVRETLLGTSNAFRLFVRTGVDATKMNQGLVDSVKAYAEALERAGVPAQNALELAGNQVKQMANLNEAQEAFISQTTGGPGGIRGALELEDLMDRDPLAAQRKMVDAMKQAVGGRIITREEALRTGQEQQYLMQRQMLMQGTLGMKAGSRAEAQDMIEAMARGIPFKAPSDVEKEKAAAETIQRGQEQEKLTYTGIKEASLTAERVMLQAGTINLGTVQNAFAAGAGTIPTGGRGINVQGREILGTAMATGAAGSGGAAPIADAFHKLSRTMTDLPTLVTSAGRSLKEQMTTPEQSAALGTMTPQEIAAVAAEQARAGAPGTLLGLGAAGGAAATPTGEMPGTIPGLSTRTNVPGPQFQPGTSAARQVGAALPGLSGGGSPGSSVPIPGTRTNPAGAAAPGPIPGLGGGPIPVTIAGGSLRMDLSGICPHCKGPITTSLQGQATNVAANPE